MKLWWPVVRTQHYDLLLVRLWERVPMVAVPRSNDDGAMDGGAEHGAVRVPPQRPLLPGHVVPVGVARAESWAVPGRHGTDPSCFGLNRAGPIRHGILPGRAVLGLRPETTAQHGPKARRATFGPCQPKHGPQIMNTTI